MKAAKPARNEKSKNIIFQSSAFHLVLGLRVEVELRGTKKLRIPL